MLPLPKAGLLNVMVSPNTATMSEAADTVRMDDRAENPRFIGAAPSLE
jgi:hypothetical protein